MHEGDVAATETDEHTGRIADNMHSGGTEVTILIREDHGIHLENHFMPVLGDSPAP